jgi:diguanylate cyclase (GGDEF)-like protein/PAS domain S-box-containing protein
MFIKHQEMLSDAVKFRFRLLVLVFIALLSPLWAQTTGSAEVQPLTADLLTPPERDWLVLNQNRLVLAVETGYAPFVFLDQKGDIAGLAHEHLLLLETKLGIHFAQQRFASLAEAFGAIRRGEIALVNAVAKTPMRSEFLSFTSPFIALPNAIIVRKESSAAMTQASLAGLQVSLVKNYAVTEYLGSQDLPMVLQLVPDDLSALLDVSFGRSDATVIDLATASYLIQQKAITNLRVAGEVGSGVELSIASSKKEPLLGSILQKGLAAITAQERRTIRERWINSSGNAILLDHRIWFAVAAIVLLVFASISGMFLWNRALRRQVVVRTADIAREKEALRESEEKHRLLVENSHDAIYTLTPQGVFTFVSSAWTTVLGHPVSAVVGRSFKTFIHPQDVDACMSFFENVITTGERQEGVEFRVRNRHGEWRWYNSNAVALKDEGGNVVGVQGSSIDVTQRKQSEDETRIAATAFEAQQGMAVTNADRVILRVNRAFTEITGYSAEEAVGQNPRLLSSGRHDASYYAAMWNSILLTGTWQGEIWNRRKCGEVYPEWLAITAVKNDAAQTTHYVATFSDITARKSAEDQIQSLAFFDPLTHLPNRRLLIDRLQQALAASMRHQQRGALMLVNLENFKTLNDSLGHYKGDLLLQQVAQRLTVCIREGDTVARLGSDEFMVMLESLSETALVASTQAEAVAEKILALLNQGYQLGRYPHQSTASIGITLFGAQQEAVSEPLKRADLAMHQAKVQGQNTFRFFDPEMQVVVTARAALESGLREAILKNQFMLHYQPQVLGEHQIVGVEALVRWKDPSRGMVSPAEFIPLAEETGLILPLGQWVLETACLQLVQWSTRAEMSHLTMAVNVSARQFHQRDFVDQVLATVARTGANPHRLKMELTESLLVANIEDVIGKMIALKDNGIGFSLDDFGTGYSSLSYMKRLPLDQLKIDQGFVRDILTDPNDAAIAKMVVALAESMGLAVIAEGVETPEQREFLNRLGCPAYQGYLFSRPLPVEDFEMFF